MVPVRAGHYQNAYVTRNIEKTVSAFRAIADVRMITEHDGAIAVRTPAGVLQMHNKLALIWVGDLQYEFIEPVGGAVEFYREALPDDDAPRFHHVCMRVPDWELFRRSVDETRFPVVIEGEAGPLKFIYLDARATLGHYLEYTYMPDEIWAASGGR